MKIFHPILLKGGMSLRIHPLALSHRNATCQPSETPASSCSSRQTPRCFRTPYANKLRSLLRTLRGTRKQVPGLLGLVLLVAATLKAHQVAAGPNGESGLFTSRWSLTGLIELELALGL